MVFVASIFLFDWGILQKVPLAVDYYLSVTYTFNMFDYNDAVSFLNSLMDYEKSPAQRATTQYLNLQRMQQLLDICGSPQLCCPAVHIAGTKGKGSTAAITAAILRAAGLKVGLYTSPHLLNFRERITINGEMISEAELTELVQRIVPIIEKIAAETADPPTFFEVYTVLALLFFASKQVDCMALETGMGGRLDATNVVQPLVTAITAIALDHMVELGDNLAAIAGEKAGIIKPGVAVISAPQHAEAAQIIWQIASEQQSPLYRVGTEITVKDEGPVNSPPGQIFSISGRLNEYPHLNSPLLGMHQQDNTAVAIGIIECLQEKGFPIKMAAIRNGIAQVQWPGRMQVVNQHPLLLLDGAHDPAAISALLAGLTRHFPGKRYRFVLGFLQEKDWPAMLAQLAPSASQFIFTRPGSPRAAAPTVLLAQAMKYPIPADCCETVGEAIEIAIADINSDEMICVTGSLYLVADALRYWQNC